MSDNTRFRSVLLILAGIIFQIVGIGFAIAAGMDHSGSGLVVPAVGLTFMAHLCTNYGSRE